MPRICTVCKHLDLDAINRTLVSGTDSNRIVAQRFGLSAHAIDRHKHHLARIPAARRLASQLARREERQAVKLADLVSELREDARRLLAKSEAAKDYRSALVAVRELARLAELGARANGELRAPGSQTTTTVQVLNVGQARSDAEAERWARLTLQILEDERRDALLAAAAEGSSGP